MLTVFGSINVDLILRCAALPREGETVLAQQSAVAAGGKGANQAHAAARLGTPTALVGAVGRDALADIALRGLQAVGVDLNAVARVNALTGCASVALGPDGHNQIIVASGANAFATDSALTDLQMRASRMLLTQMELPLEPTLAVLRRAKAAGVMTVLNNAPAVELSPDALRLVDVLVVNEHELAATLRGIGAPAPDLTSAATSTPNGLHHALAALADWIGYMVVVTLGERGCIAWHRDSAELLRLPAKPVAVLDTTGAGDQFCGALCAALLRGDAVPAALEFANAQAALACTWLGAQCPG